MTDKPVSRLHQAVAKLGEIPLENRSRPRVDHVLEALFEDGFNIGAVNEHGLANTVYTGSYGRGMVHEIPGIEIPTGMEMLVVTVPAGYAPAIHDHSETTIGANLLALQGTFFNVDYRFIPSDDGGYVLDMHAIQKVEEGEVAFVSAGRSGIHRVVNASKEGTPSVSLNVYWTNNPEHTEINTNAYVFDFGVGGGTRVTSGGPAFFFVDGADKQTGLKATPLVQLEDLVLQHFQLVAAQERGVSTPERDVILEKLGNMVRDDKFQVIYREALEKSGDFIRTRRDDEKGVATEYFKALFARTKKLAAAFEVTLPEVPGALIYGGKGVPSQKPEIERQ